MTLGSAFNQPVAIVETPKDLMYCAHPQPEAGTGRGTPGINQRHGKHIPITDDVQHRMVLHGFALAVLFLQTPDQPGLLIWREPACVLRLVRQPEQGDEAEDYGRRGFQDEQPLPSGRPSTPFMPSNAAEMGEPTKPETGIATMKIPTILARCSAGNQ